MRLPDFLVIGAMKAATTTLYHDLLAHPDIFVAEKEVGFLLKDLSAEQYAAPFSKAGPAQLCGDVATDYTKLPDHPEVVPRAKKLLPGLSKIIYVVREPVSRVVSHHHFMRSWRGPERTVNDINRSVIEDPSLIQYSQYAMQLRPWANAFGPGSVLVVKFEDFVRFRTVTLNQVYGFLGVALLGEHVRTEIVHNPSDRRPVLNDFWSNIRELVFYRRIVRPLLSQLARDRFRELLLPKAPPRPAPPSLQTIEYIVDRVREDVEQLRVLLGHPEPLWDMDAVLKRHRQAHSKHRHSDHLDAPARNE